jgi:hypothetical protein
MFFRRASSPFPAMEASLRAVEPETRYRLSISQGYNRLERKNVWGRELAQLPVTLPEAPDCVLVEYSKL